MGESERKGKEAGEVKTSRQNKTFINGEDPFNSACLGIL